MINAAEGGESSFHAFQGLLRVLIRPDTPQSSQSALRVKGRAAQRPGPLEEGLYSRSRRVSSLLGAQDTGLGILGGSFWIFLSSRGCFGSVLTLQIIDGYIVLEKHISLTVKAKVPCY